MRFGLDISFHQIHPRHDRWLGGISRVVPIGGGILLLYKDYLKDGIEIIKNRYDTVIWLKLDEVFF